MKVETTALTLTEEAQQTAECLLEIKISHRERGMRRLSMASHRERKIAFTWGATQINPKDSEWKKKELQSSVNKREHEKGRKPLYKNDAGRDISTRNRGHWGITED